MTKIKTFEICPKCGKNIVFTDNGKGLYRHLSKHNNPNSRLCTAWYKNYFEKFSMGTSTCKICGEELYHDESDPFSNHQYQDHLKSHGITE